MKIGRLAKAVNCHVETVRYYEKEGQLPSSEKSANGYGEYSDVHLNLLRLIRHSKDLGFPQKQVRELVRLAISHDASCNEVHQLTLTQLEFIKEKLKGLRKMQKDLSLLSKACEQNKHQDCPVLNLLVQDLK